MELKEKLQEHFAAEKSGKHAGTEEAVVQEARKIEQRLRAFGGHGGYGRGGHVDSYGSYSAGGLLVAGAARPQKLTSRQHLADGPHGFGTATCPGRWL